MSFIVHCAGGFLLLPTTGFFMSSNVGTTLRLSVFYPVPWIHLCHLSENKINIWVHYLHWSFLSLLFAKSGYTLKPFLSSLWVFWKVIKKTMPVLILALLCTLHCVFLQVGTHTTPLGFLGPFPTSYEIFDVGNPFSIFTFL